MLDSTIPIPSENAKNKAANRPLSLEDAAYAIAAAAGRRFTVDNLYSAAENEELAFCFRTTTGDTRYLDSSVVTVLNPSNQGSYAEAEICHAYATAEAAIGPEGGLFGDWCVATISRDRLRVDTDQLQRFIDNLVAPDEVKLLALLRRDKHLSTPAQYYRALDWASREDALEPRYRTRAERLEHVFKEMKPAGLRPVKGEIPLSVDALRKRIDSARKIRRQLQERSA